MNMKKDIDEKLAKMEKKVRDMKYNVEKMKDKKDELDLPRGLSGVIKNLIG